MSQTTLKFSVLGLGFSTELLFLEEQPLEEQPIIEVNLIKHQMDKLDQNSKNPVLPKERPQKIILRGRKKNYSTNDWVPHFQRNVESMSFEKVTSRSKEGFLDQKSKAWRFNQNEKNRLAKPKTKMTKRAWREAGEIAKRFTPDSKTLNHALYYGPKFETIIRA